MTTTGGIAEPIWLVEMQKKIAEEKTFLRKIFSGDLIAKCAFRDMMRDDSSSVDEWGVIWNFPENLLRLWAEQLDPISCDVDGVPLEEARPIWTCKCDDAGLLHFCGGAHGYGAVCLCCRECSELCKLISGKCSDRFKYPCGRVYHVRDERGDAYFERMLRWQHLLDKEREVYKWLVQGHKERRRKRR